MLILDTNTISYYFRNEACVVQQLQATPLQYLAVPAIVVYELQYGILRLAHEAAQPRLKGGIRDTVIAMQDLLKTRIKEAEVDLKRVPEWIKLTQQEQTELLATLSA